MSIPRTLTRLITYTLHGISNIPRSCKQTILLAPKYRDDNYYIIPREFALAINVHRKLLRRAYGH